MKKYLYLSCSSKSLRLLSALLAFCLTISTFAPLSFAQEDTPEAENSTPVEKTVGPDNFVKVNDYIPNQFADVPASEWYADSVRAVFEYGLMLGISENEFNPSGNMSIAESLTIASRLHNTYYGKNYVFQNSDPWYQTYVDYTLEENIIAAPYGNYSVPISRSEFAVIIANAFPLSAINKIESGAIPDIKKESVYYDEVYLLYRAGILSGVDSIGTYNPDSQISRAEVAVILTRIANEQSRIHFELKAPVFPESISMSESFYVPIGDSGKIKTKIAPENADRGTKIEWSSSDPAIASVDENGRVTGNAVGTAEITAMTENGKTAVCRVYIVTQEVIDQIYAKVTLSQLKKQLKFPDTLTIYGVWARDTRMETEDEVWIEVFIYYSAANSLGMPVRKEFRTVWKMNTGEYLFEREYNYTSDHTLCRIVNFD